MMDNKKLVRTREMLTPRQQRFLAFYLDPDSPTRFVASKSVKAAGYSPNPNACRVMGSRLLRHPKICAHLEAALDDAGISRDFIVAKLAELVRAPWREPVSNKTKLAGMKMLAGLIEGDGSPTERP